ncbi:MAG TPA: type II toxin-antitoxin system prevent-host-death family antitoxin [Candidatus Elarobacter sp.]|nr:type II toxin-antitoxin system prevent-host-death family antitoxin [Candidatus Elarobacter sp.]
MRDTYSLYEAKARLSAIVRQVREGHSVVITVHGEPAVEIRPIAARREGTQARLDRLAERGVLVRPAQSRRSFGRVARRPGALQRFLADRDE